MSILVAQFAQPFAFDRQMQIAELLALRIPEED